MMTLVTFKDNLSVCKTLPGLTASTCRIHCNDKLVQMKCFKSNPFDKFSKRKKFAEKEIIIDQQLCIHLHCKGVWIEFEKITLKRKLLGYKDIFWLEMTVCTSGQSSGAGRGYDNIIYGPFKIFQKFFDLTWHKSRYYCVQKNCRPFQIKVDGKRLQ